MTKGKQVVQIGIDPGKGGGIAFIKRSEVTAFKCPDTPYECVKLFKQELKGYVKITAMIERVHSMPLDGVRSAFSFGTNYGMWHGILAALGIPFKEVTPHKWQKSFGTMPKEKKSRKHRLKSLAQQMFPNTKVTLYTSDALLIAQYGKELGSI